MENEKLKMENYKQTELGLIPEDWVVKKLGELGKIINGLTYSPENIKENGTLVLRSSNVQNDKIVYDDNVFVEENISFNPTKKDDVLICVRNGSRGLIGKTALIDEQASNVAFGAFMAIYRSNSNNYIYNYFKSNYFFKEVHKNLGATINSINNNDLKKFKIPLPPLLEQKKIADCLSTWDVAIEKQNALINALTQRKKALMQQLLTGKKRLPGFEGKWNLNSINDLFIFKNGKAHENDIDENGKYILVNSKFISTDGEILKKTNSNLAPLEVNDLVFVMSDVPNGKALAKFFLIKEDNLYTLNQRIGLLKIKKGNPIFMYYLLNRNAYFLMFDNGVGQTNLRKDDILDCPLNIPSLSEQTAIAEILATADRELTLQKEKLAQLQTQKKGLMQVLLTGKKRLIN